MEFSYRVTGTGWSEAHIADADRTLALEGVSYLSDALSELLDALVSLKRGAEEASASWWQEPGAYEWKFKRAGEEVDLEIREFNTEPGNHGWFERGWVVFRTRQPLDVLVAAIAGGASRLLDEVGEEGYLTEWGEPFPARQLQELLPS